MGETGARTLTLLFTDLEGSTRALLELGDERYTSFLDEHRSVLSAAFAARGGRYMGSEGDSLFYVFTSASQAVTAAVEAQAGVSNRAWPTEVGVRMGLHTGEVLEVGAEVRGLAVHQAARVMSAAHGGQILVSKSTADLASRQLGASITLEDLGSFRLKDLAEPVALFTVRHLDIPSDFPPPKTLDLRPHNLPVQLTSLVGRARELEQIKDLVLSTDLRLVTLSGPGGIGKTRLAVQVAADVVEDFEDGVWFVDLAPLRDPARVATTILTALGAEEEPARSHEQTLLEFLRNKRSLLVLDNFEQLVPAAHFVSEVLRATPGVKVLVTSRAVLRLRGEREFEVPAMEVAIASLDVDAVASADASALFLERTLAMNPSFMLTAEVAGAVTELCSRLDGLPLAIELAASRSKVLTPRDLLERLGSHLDLLATDSRDAPERQRTMRSTIAWSYDLLNDEEKRSVRWFSVFRGGANLEAAEAVSGSIQVISSLVDHSLVRRALDSAGGARLEMLDSIREFAAEELRAAGEDRSASAAHAAFFVDYAERAEPQLRAGEQARWLEALEREIDNLRAVVAWALSEEGDAENGLRLLSALTRFWRIRGYSREIQGDVDELLDRSSAPTLARARSLVLRGRLRFERRETFERPSRKQSEEILPLYEEALAIARQHGDIRLQAETLTQVGLLRRGLKGVKDRHVRSLFVEALDLAEQIGDQALITDIRARAPVRGPRSMSVGFRQGLGTYMADERLAAARASGDRATESRILLARAQSTMSDPDGSRRRMVDESLKTARELGDREQEAESLLQLGKLDCVQYRFEDSRTSLFAGRRIYEELEDDKGIGRSALELASLGMHVGDWDASRRYSREVREIGRRSNDREFRVLGFLAGSRAARVVQTVLPLVAAVLVTLSLAVWDWGLLPALAVALSVWAISSTMRAALVRYVGARRRFVGTLMLFPFTAATLLIFWLGYLMQRPGLAGALLLLMMVPKYRSRATLPASWKGLGIIAAISGIVLSVADIFVSPRGIAGSLLNAAPVAAASIVIALMGYGSREATTLWRVGQTGWFFFRFGWPVLALTALAMHRGFDMGAWFDWSKAVTAGGAIVVALALLVDGMRLRVPAVLIFFGTVSLALSLFGVADTAAVGGGAFGLGWAWAALIMLNPGRIMKVDVADEPSQTGRR